MVKQKQTPGKFHVFINHLTGEKVKVLLPPTFGVGNKKVKWQRNPTCKAGGCWTLRKFQQESDMRSRRGLGPQGLLTKMSCIIRHSREWAKRLGYIPICETSEKMLEQWKNQNDRCAACGNLFFGKVCYDHDHKTGRGRGFLHNECNKAEGSLNKLSDESFVKFITWMRPHLFKQGVE